ncbi:hypothetical protein Q8F55_008457 [Vanrija albida]|uniref:Uncharacterized protein n=1 Tax=Vanrija albida TaxID=181172 RepID=A0ABR3PQW4_9TREE
MTATVVSPCTWSTTAFVTSATHQVKVNVLDVRADQIGAAAGRHRSESVRDVDFALPVKDVKSDSEHMYVRLKDEQSLPNHGLSRFIVLSF